MQELTIGETLKTYTGEDYKSSDNDIFIVRHVSGFYPRIISHQDVDCMCVVAKRILKTGKQSKKDFVFWVSKWGSIYPA